MSANFFPDCQSDLDAARLLYEAGHLVRSSGDDETNQIWDVALEYFLVNKGEEYGFIEFLAEDLEVEYHTARRRWIGLKSWVSARMWEMGKVKATRSPARCPRNDNSEAKQLCRKHTNSFHLSESK